MVLSKQEWLVWSPQSSAKFHKITQIACALFWGDLGNWGNYMETRFKESKCDRYVIHLDLVCLDIQIPDLSVSFFFYLFVF